MDIRKLQRTIVDGLEDVKGQNIVVFNTEHLSALFERVIIASGTSNRQTKALASGVREAVRDAGYPVPRMEGEVNGEWIIVDCGAAVVHVMQPSIREYYHLEEIWGDKPVKMKIGNVATKLVKAAEPDARVPARRVAAKKVAAKKVAAKRVAAPRPAAKKAAATKTAAKTAARKAPARKTAVTGRATVTRVVGVKRAAAKQPAAKAPAARQPAARKAPARKSVRKA